MGMPRIEAPTVAEHSAMRRRQVVEAAAAVLSEKGVSGFTPAQVAGKAGLARSSMYQYYPSTEALMGAAIAELLGRSRDRMRAAVAGADTPSARVAAYIEAALDDATSGHGSLPDLARMEMPDSCRAGVRQLHDELLEPLRSALRDGAVADPATTALLVSGVIASGVTSILHGSDRDRIAEATVTFCLRAVALD